MLVHIMTYEDRVYGTFEITDPVILDLIECPTMQRLKEIDQAGYFEPFVPGSSHSRFEHSVGVYLLLRKYGASIEEQIAGLIHDVSHTAFSHCIDYVLSGGSSAKQVYQDNIFEEFVKKSEIPEILAKYKIDLAYILDEGNFPLKEQPLPDLCADRIDYSLRDGIIYGVLTVDEANRLLNQLKVREGRWLFTDIKDARRFANIFAKLNSNFWAGLPSAVMFRTLADYLLYALNEKYINEADLHSTDKFVLKKIAPFRNSDPYLRLLFARLCNQVMYTDDSSATDGEVVCKSRAVNPSFLTETGVHKLSDIDQEWGEILRAETEPKKYHLKFER